MLNVNENKEGATGQGSVLIGKYNVSCSHNSIGAGEYKSFDDSETLLGCSKTVWRDSRSIQQIIQLPLSQIEKSLNRLLAAGLIEVDHQAKDYYRRC